MKLDKKTTVLITGCGGMLGEAVYDKFAKEYTVLATDIDLNEPWLKYLDVRDLNGIQKIAREFKPDLIINLAALTDLEFCETHPDVAWATNASGQENICAVARDLDCAVVYISTAGIFDGEKEFYDDFDVPNPISVYAKSKYHGEVITPKLIERHFIFRAGWMMGGGPKKDKKFINKIFKQIKSGKKELFVIEDKLGTPTYTLDFAGQMLKVVESGLCGLYNMVCTGEASRYDVAQEFLRYLHLEDKIKLTIVSSEYFNKEYFAPRPASEKLIDAKLIKNGLMIMRDWKECLAEYSKVFLQELK
ncbi:MAG: NAD(P)-dependent oxidoreductase [Proteobacteria bacterium]|nr:NAD(P)-dependent oxidoreductase [Pseudomonadota bacterium]